MSVFSEDKLPTSFVNEVQTISSNKIVVRSSVKSLEDCNKWVKEFGILTCTKWNSRTSNPNGELMICSKRFVCHHSAHAKVPAAQNKRGVSKNSSCQAMINVKVKLNTKGTRRNDPFVRKGLLAVITINDDHNHSVDSADILKFLPADDCKDKFFEYFNDGMGITAARKHHQELLLSDGKYTEKDLANNRINPSYRSVHHWHDLWCQEDLDSETDQDLIEIRRKKGGRYRRRKFEMLGSDQNSEPENNKSKRFGLRSSEIKEGLIPAPAKKPRTEEDEATSQEAAATSQGAASTSQGATSASQGAASTSQEATATSQEVTIKVEPTVDVENETVDVEQPDAQPSIDLGQTIRKKKASKFTPGPYFIKGRRIVDAGYFITELLNLNVHNQSGRCGLADMSTSMECTKGIVSGFVFKCKVCRFRTVIWTEDPESHSDMNADAILATMDLVDDLQSMNKYFTKMKLPRFNRHFFKWKYKRLTKEPVVGEEEAGDEEEWCEEKDMDMQCEGEKAEVLIDDSIVIKEEPEDVFSDAENEELTGSTQMGGISSSQSGVAIERDKNVAAVGGSSSTTAQRDKQSIETFTIDAGSERSCSKTDQLVTIPKNSEAGANVRDNSSVSIIESNLHKTTLDSTFGSCTEGTKQPYVAGCITLAESNLSKRVYAYSVEFLVSLSKFAWSSLFVCVDCLEDFATHELIKAHCCKTYSKSILGVPPLTDFQRKLPTEKTRACFETLKSSMAEKKSFLDLAVSSSKEVQRMMNLHAQHRRGTEEKMKKYEQAVAMEKAQKSKNPDVSNAVTAAFSEIQDSLASEETAENLLKGAKRNQVNLLEAAAEATERECLALVDFVKSLREDQVDSPQKTSENRQEHPGASTEIPRKYRSPNKNFRFDELEYRFGSPRRTSENRPEHPSITYKEKPQKPKRNFLLDQELQSKVTQLMNKNVFILPKSSGNQS